MTACDNRPTFREKQEIASVWRRRRNRACLPVIGMAGVAIALFLLARGIIPLPDGMNEHAIAGVGYAAVLLFFFLFRRCLACPVCGGRVWPPRAAVCPHCGIALRDITETARLSAPAASAPAPFQCEAARKKLAERMKVFDTLRRYERFMYCALIPVSLAAGAWLYFAVSRSELWVPLVAAAVVYLIGWFLLIYVLHNVCFPILWITRARCPHCGTPFSSDLVAAVPGYIGFHSFVPDFCTGCGCRFRPEP